MLELFETPITEKTLVRNNKQYVSLLQHLKTAKHIAVDVETSGPEPEDALNPWAGFLVGVGFAICDAPDYIESYYVPMSVDHDVVAYDGMTITNDMLKTLLFKANPEAIWYMHNAKFDMKWLELATGYRFEIERLIDPMVEMWLARTDDPKGLKDLTKRFFPSEPEPIRFEKLLGIGKNKKKLQQIHPGEIANYCCADAINTLRIAPKVRELVDKLGPNTRRILFELEMPLLRLLADMELRGMQLDKKKLEELTVEFLSKLESVEEHLKNFADINWSAPQQVIKVFREHGIKIPKKQTATGKQSLDIEVLDQMSDEYEIVRQLLMYKGLKKLVTTYLDSFYSRSDHLFRIHAEFRQTGTRTGRLSCGEPNLQNIPARPKKNSPLEESYMQLRKLFIGSPNLIVADLSQIELRLAAHFSKDPSLVHAFRNDEDIHKMTADDITGGDRFLAKNVNFGYLYGQRAKGLDRLTGCGMDRARKFIALFEKKYHKLNQWVQLVEIHARDSGYVETILGRRRYLADIHSADWGKSSAAARQAVNTLIQGSAADYLKIAMLRIDRELRPMGIHLICQVHDELIWDCDPGVTPDTMREACKIIQHHMETAIPLIIPVKTEPKIVQNWGQAK